jgi:ABC-2 type transport system permease protein
MSGVVKVVEVPASEDLEAYISENSLSVALRIPSDFTARILAHMAGDNSSLAKVQLFGDPSQSVFGTVQGAVYGAVDAVNFHLADAEPVVTMSAEPLPGAQGYTYMDYFLPGVIGMTVMTTAFFTMTSVCASYRSRGYFKLLATTKLAKFEWLITKFVFLALLLSLSMITTYIVGVLLFDMQSSLTLLTFVFIAAGTFLFTSMGMLVGSAIKDPESGMAISNAIGFPMMFLSGSFFPVESFPPFLQQVANLLPLTYLNDGLRDTMVFGNIEGALIDLAVVVGVGIVLAIAGSRLMSWKEA